MPYVDNENDREGCSVTAPSSTEIAPLCDQLESYIRFYRACYYSFVGMASLFAAQTALILSKAMDPAIRQDELRDYIVTSMSLAGIGIMYRLFLMNRGLHRREMKDFPALELRMLHLAADIRDHQISSSALIARLHSLNVLPYERWDGDDCHDPFVIAGLPRILPVKPRKEVEDLPRI